MDDRRQADLQSVSFNARFRLLGRDHFPFGLTLSVEPHWGFADEVSGVPKSAGFRSTRQAMERHQGGANMRCWSRLAAMNDGH
jgi:hypothetical protein